MKTFPLFIYLVLIATFGYSQNCEINKSKLASSFSIFPSKKINLKKAKAGEYYAETISIKFPNNTTEILTTDVIKCPSYIPGGVTIRDIKILNIEGLPTGITINCDKPDCFWEKATYGCVNVEGKSNQKGQFPLIVHVKGIANVLFVPVAVKCVLEGYILMIE